MVDTERYRTYPSPCLPGTHGSVWMRPLWATELPETQAPSHAIVLFQTHTCWPNAMGRLRFINRAFQSQKGKSGVLSVEQRLKLKITDDLLWRIFPLTDGYIAKLGNVKGSLSHFAASEMVTGSAVICWHRSVCSRGWQKPINAKKYFSLSQIYGNWMSLTWLIYLGRYWELHLSRFPRMQLGTNLQEQQFTFPNYRAQEWHSGKNSAATKQGNYMQKPHSKTVRENC